MNKELALNIIQLLSALEAIGIVGKNLPAYLSEQLTQVIQELSEIVLAKEDKNETL